MIRKGKEGVSLTILITAFDPFGGEPGNASAEVMARLTAPPGAALVTEIVPTSFSRAANAVVARMRALRPDAVLCLGEAAGRREITPERVAVNRIDARIPDNDGCQPTGVPVIPGAPDALCSTLPLRRMEEAIRSAGVPVSLSDSAGSFVCNALMFAVLYEAKTALPDRPVGFLHVPCLPEQGISRGLPSMGLSEAVRGVQAAVNALAASEPE